MKPRRGIRIEGVLGMAALLLVATEMTRADTIYSDDSATNGLNNGSSWVDAFLELPSALAAAQAGDEIRVAAGVYKPDYNVATGQHTGERTATFQLKNAVGLYGGYAGHGAPDPDLRDIDSNASILSGDLAGNDGPNFAHNGENSYHVVTGSDTDATAVLDGFTMRGGNANASSPPYRNGGGMYNSGGGPTLAHCTFDSNSAYYNGGGMYNTFSSPTLTHCTFSGNSAHSSGGGMDNYNNSNPTLTDCTFNGNSAVSFGGAIGNDSSSPILTNCTLKGNSANYGGGMDNYDSSPTLTGCTFRANSATGTYGSGGGMYNDSESGATLTDCTFSDNAAYHSGGGIYNSSASPTLINCTLSGNSAYYGGGGMYNYGDSNPTLTRCAFKGNSAYYYGGGGIYNYLSSSPTLTDGAFSGNSATGPFSSGGAMYNYSSSSPTVTHCTFSGNSAAGPPGSGGGIYNYFYSSPTLTNCILWSNRPDAIVSHFRSAPAVAYSDVQSGYAGPGNVDADPLFVRNPDDGGDGWGDDPATPEGDESANDDYGDLHLTPDSPCVNTGSNYVPDLPAEDLEGHPRIRQCRVDMGAYESPYPAPGFDDCNSNGSDDTCDVYDALSADCNQNHVPDECDLVESSSTDCNNNGLPDECDIASGTSTDCSTNGVPDECEPDCDGNGVADSCDITTGTSMDCNSNGVPDECEITAGTSQDCDSNGVPDGCEPDCNSNSIADACDLTIGTSRDCQPNGIPDECDLAAGTSADCQPNGTLDECELVGNDCNANRVPDDCDLAAGTSTDCDGNGVPDECETDCNINGIPDECDLAAGTSRDCNTNGRPDECDAEHCHDLWNGFQGLVYQTPMHGLDLDGDGVAWVNPANTAKIWLYGCEFAGTTDRSVQVTVATDPPEDGYLVSEYFRSNAGALLPDEEFYRLDFKPRLEGYLNPKTDWQFFLYDAKRALAVVEIDWTSTLSMRVPADQRGQMLVKNPAGAPDYLHTGVATSLSHCWDFQVVLNNLDGTVQVYIDGVARLNPPLSPLEVGAGRLDYFRVQAVANEAGSGGNTAFKLDAFHLCALGALAPPDQWDCNGNRILDECDMAGGTSRDCNTNDVPDECDIAGGASPDANGNGTPDECEPPPALLTAATPADQSSLWRSANNTIRLTFDGDITVPQPGQVRIQELLPDGAFGPDLSTNGFMFTVEDVVEGTWESLVEQSSFAPPGLETFNTPRSQGWRPGLPNSVPPGLLIARTGQTVGDDDAGRPSSVATELSEEGVHPQGAEAIAHPRILKIRENGSVLAHRTWYAIRNLGGVGGWAGVGPFEAQYVVQVGDVNADGKVLANDLSAIFPKIPTNPAGDQERADVNGDGHVLANDLSAMFPRIPSAPVPKPSGH